MTASAHDGEKSKRAATREPTKGIKAVVAKTPINGFRPGVPIKRGIHKKAGSKTSYWLETPRPGVLELAMGAQVLSGGKKSQPQGSSKARKSSASSIPEQSVNHELTVAGVIEGGIDIKLINKDDPLIALMVKHDVVPRTTIISARKGKAKTLTPANSEKILRVMRAAEQVSDAFGEKHVLDWLGEQNPSFGNVAPMSLLKTDAGARAVELYLGQVKHGLFA